MDGRHACIVKRTAIVLSTLCLLWIVPTVYCILGQVTNHNALIFMKVLHGAIFGAAVWVLFYSLRRLQALDLAQEANARRQAEQLYRSMFENMHEAGAYCRMVYEDGRPVDFIYLDVNESFLKMTGLTGAIGKRVTEIFPGIQNLEPSLIEIAGRVARSGKSEVFETYLSDKGIWLSNSIYSPQKEHFIGVFEDITERKRLMDSLREREEIYSAIVNQAAEGMALIDVETLGFVEFNEATRQIFGYTREEFAALTLNDLIADMTRDEVVRHIRDVADRGGADYVAQRRHHSGRLIDMNISTRTVRLHGRDFVAAIWRDVTEQRRAEEALRESEGKFRSYIEHSPVAIIVMDSQGRHVDSNPAARAMLGYDADTISKLSFHDVISPMDLERGIRDFATLIERGNYESEYEVRRGDGFPINMSIRTVRIGGNRYMGFATDITDRKRAEQALRESEAKYRGLFENSMDGILLTIPDGRITAANPAACAMFGMSEEEICSLGRDGLVDPSETRMPSVLDRRAKFGRANYEMVYRRKDGTLFHSENTSALLDGGARAFVMIHDITNRKRAEEERQKLQAQLLHSQKMEAIGQLAGGVAHDFNNLLTVIIGYSEMLLAKLPETDPNRGYVADIHESGERAASLTRQLLAFSRKQILAPKIVNINTIIANVEKMLRRLIGEDVILTTELLETVRPVEVDPTQIEQVVINLAVNARDAMSKGGQLFIETGNCMLDEAYCHLHPGIKPGEYVVISMTDTGCGMDETVRAKIFEPFFTTKEQGRGTGLGLATVFGIVKQSGGYIDVMSGPGIGSCFKIYLPSLVQKSDKAGPDADADDDSKIPFGSETILLIEDEEAVRRIARLALETHGYRVIEADGGKAAMGIAADPAARIDLLVTDVVMPDMNGPELVGRLQGIRPGLRVLYISGYTDDSIFQRGFTGAGIGYLPKPFAPVALARRVRQILDADE